MNIIRDTIIRSYNCFKLDTKAIVKEVVKLFKDDRFTLNSLVNTLPFTIPD